MVAATGVGLALDQRRMRAALVQIRGDHTHHGAAARRSGFECHQCHGILPQALAITSIVWPSAKRTYALRQSLRRPSRKRKALTFPLTFRQFTASTLTLNNCPTAAFTSALVAVVATSNTYWLDASFNRAVFLDMRGARSTLRIFALLKIGRASCRERECQYV